MGMSLVGCMIASVYAGRALHRLGKDGLQHERAPCIMLRRSNKPKQSHIRFLSGADSVRNL